MIEVAKEIKVKGLRPFDHLGVNSGFTLSLNNVVMRGETVKMFKPIVNPLDYDFLLTADISDDWPFPQMFLGTKNRFLAAKTSLFWLDDEWSAYNVNVFDSGDPSVEGSILAGDPWQFVDMGEAFLFTNGNSFIFKFGDGAPLAVSDKVLVNSKVKVKAASGFRGRVVFGGFDQDHFWTEKIRMFFERWNGKESYGINPDLKVDNNFIWWSSIGGGDVFWMVFPELYIKGVTTYGNEDDEDSLIFDYLKRNESGFMAMSWYGYVRKIIPLGETALVLGDNGVSLIFPAKDPVPTMGEKVISSRFGIGGVAAAASNNDYCLFINSFGELVAVDGKGEVQVLGYKEWLKPLLDVPVMMSYSSYLDRFFISTNDFSYVYTSGGLTRVDQKITSVVDVNGDSFGFSSDMDEDNFEFSLETDKIDFGVRGIKTITQVDYRCNLEDVDSIIYVGVWYRLSSKKDFSFSGWRAANSFGICRFYVSGEEFKIAVKVDNWKAIKDPAKSITVWVALTDKRFVRGQHAVS